MADSRSEAFKMWRILLLLSLIVPAGVLVPKRVAAQAGWQTVSSPFGYSLQVPSNWNRLANPPESPNGVIVGSGADKTWATLIVLQGQVPPGVDVSSANLAVLQGTVQAMLQASSGETAYVVTSGPTPTALAGADLAALASASYVDSDGTPMNGHYLFAVKDGDTSYALAVQAPSLFDQQYPSLAQQIISSFQLSPTSTSSANPPSAPLSSQGPVAAPFAPQSLTPPAPGSGLGDGTYIVGRTIQPGSYATLGGPGCYWARLRTPDIAAGQIIYSAYAAHGSTIVITPADVAFFTEGCAPWYGPGIPPGQQTAALTSAPTSADSSSLGPAASAAARSATAPTSPPAGCTSYTAGTCGDHGGEAL